MPETSTTIASEKNDSVKWNKEVKTSRKDMTSAQGNFKAICGEILIDSPAKENPKPKVAKVFYTAYFAENKNKNKNLMFLFNGGPGSSSVWLHFGAFGPMRVNNLDVGISKQSELVENTESLLAQCDLVFVDPIGTGFSTCEDGQLKHFCSERADAVYLSQFISQFLVVHKLWDRHVLLCGESYGGYRISLMAQELMKVHNIHPTGLIMIAPFLSGTSIEESSPNIIGETNFLIAYTLSAWFHKKSSLNSSCKTESEVYQAAKEFAHKEYLPARLTSSLMLLNSDLLNKISAFTGISKDVFVKNELNIFKFSENLYVGEKKFVGRIDGRYVLEYPLTYNSTEYTDPSTVAFSQRLNPLTQQFFFSQMEWVNDKAYASMSEEVPNHWVYEESFQLAAFKALQGALKLSPNLKVYTAAGYYDLAVPASTIEYDLNQIAETKDMQKRIFLDIYPAGHMMYVHDESRKTLAKKINEFIKGLSV